VWYTSVHDTRGYGVVQLAPAVTTLPACRYATCSTVVVWPHPLPAYGTLILLVAGVGCNCDVGVMATTLRLTIEFAMQACLNSGRPAVSVPRGTQMTEVSLKPTVKAVAIDVTKSAASGGTEGVLRKMVDCLIGGMNILAVVPHACWEFQT
jgi:hypothetical protein